MEAVICLDCYECAHWHDKCDRGVLSVPGGVRCILFEAQGDTHDRNVDTPGQIGLWNGEV